MAHTVAVMAAGKKGRTLKLTDFLLRWDGGRRRRQSPEEQLNVFRALAARMARKEGTS